MRFCAQVFAPTIRTCGYFFFISSSNKKLIIALCKGIEDSLGFWFRGLEFQIPGTGFQSVSVELGFWIPIFSGIPDRLWNQDSLTLCYEKLAEQVEQMKI